MSEHVHAPSKPPVSRAVSLKPAPAATLQRMCACGGSGSSGGECEECKKKETSLQRFSARDADPFALRSIKQPLDRETRASVEPQYGHDFSRIRIHAGTLESGPQQKTQAGVRPRVTINRPGDAYEQEADRVAQAMMGTFVPPTIKSSEDHGKLQHPSESDLTKGGESLPRPVADFFEPRFGRDLSAVRVHTGKTAICYNDAVNAYAFTYGNHIWLGPGLRPEPSHILAHELAHIVQQTQPARLTSTSAEPELSPSRPSVQRFAPYWMPEEFRKVGDETHALILPKLGEKYGIFTEAPVPNAGKSGATPGFEKQGGIADLYQASTTVDVFFMSEKVPKKLSSNRLLFSRLLYKGKPYNYASLSAPQADEKRRSIIHAAKAPTEILVGDLKPSHGTIEGAEGSGQIQGYVKGFKIAQENVNEMEVGKGGFEQTDAKWPPLVTGVFRRDVPEYFKEPMAKGQKVLPLKLIHNGVKVEVPKPVKGKAYVRNDSTGTWYYTWAPTTRLTSEDLPEHVKGLGTDITAKIIKPLLASPVQTAKKARPTVYASGLTTAPRQIQAQEREKAAEDIKDSFDSKRLQQWEGDHRNLRGEEQKLEKTPDFKTAEFESLAIQERKAAIAAGFHLPPISESEDATVKATSKIRFWTNPATIIFGKLRYYFGGLFVKVINAYHAIRARFKKFLHARSAPESSGLAGTIVKIVFQVLKIAARFMIDRTAGYLVDSLKAGVVQKVKSLVPEEKIEEFEAKLAEIKALEVDLERRVKETIDSVVESTIGPYEGYIKTIADWAKKLSAVANIVNKVRWGARVLACLSPPGWGCLWILAQPVLEKFASWLIDRCWFKKEIAPLLTGIDFIAGLPKNLAGFIINQIRKFLPDGFKDVFANVNTLEVDKKIDPKQICDEDDLIHRSPFEVEKEALAELRAEIGEDKWQAYIKLGKLYGTYLGDPLTEQQIVMLKEQLKQASLQSLEEAASLYGAFKPTQKITNLTAFLQDAEQKREEMYGGSGEAGGERDEGFSLSPAGKAPGATYKPTHLRFVVSEGVTRRQYVGDVIKVDLSTQIKKTGQPVTIHDVEMTVKKRVFIPSQAHPKKLIVSLEATKDQYFDFQKEHRIEAIKEIGYKSLQVKAHNKFSYTLQLK